MTTAIGVVMTEHIVAGRMENHRLVGEPVRYPGDLTEVDALTVLPGGELLEILANHVTDLAGNGDTPVEAIGVAVPGVVRHGIVEDAPNLTQIKGMRMAEELGLDARASATPTSKLNNAGFLMQETLRNAKFLARHALTPDAQAAELAISAH